MPCVRASTAFTRLDLPAPEGAATMNSWPRSAPLLKVLHLLAQLLDQHLQLDRGLGGARVDRLRAQGIRLAVELLHQEVEPAADRLRQREHAPRLGDVAGEPVEFFVDVDLLQVEHDLLLESPRLERQL